MRIRSLCSWTTRDGTRRRIRLFEAWCNLLGRCRGTKSKNPGQYWKADYEFANWKEFRKWAITHGYGAGKQLDRKRSSEPYGPGNCQWLPASEHSRKSRASHKLGCGCRMCRYPPKNLTNASPTGRIVTPPPSDVPF